MVGRIAQRILVNYRVDPDVAARLVPAPFRPDTSRGAAIAGICLLRLEDLRPATVPRRFGITSENAAHRIAVEWDGPAGRRHGVYIPRRDTSSLVTTFVGGRLFPGWHHRAAFETAEVDGRVDVSLVSSDGTTRVAVAASVADRLPGGSIFDDLDDASGFFRADPVGWSATRRPGRYDAVERAPAQWSLAPLAIERAASSFFEDAVAFPAGTVELDSALLMRPTAARWTARPPLRAGDAAGTAA
jgi:hypothetical protein